MVLNNLYTTDVTMTKNNNCFQITTLITIFAIAVAIFVQFIAAPCVSAQTSHLANGISFYNSGLFDEALDEFRAEIEINRHCPLAYYYAAKIRITREQHSRAIQNLEAAIRDSSGFHDANGLLAVTLQKSGFNPEALVEWNKFINAAGIIDGSSAPTVDSIMLPDEYHKLLQLESERKRREKILADKKELEHIEAERIENARLKAEKVKADSLEALRLERAKKNTGETPAALEIADTIEPYVEESPNTASELPSGLSDEDNTAAEIELPFEDLTLRINSSIRKGVYALVIVLFISILFILTAVYFTRKRKTAAEESNFSEEVERIINDREFELSEEKSIREFEAKKRELLQIVQPREKQPSDEYPEQTEPPVIERETVPQAKEEYGAQNVNKSNVTEEIKALVSRLYREGHTAEKIAQIADLSKTEVELILAVSEHHLDSIISDIHKEDEDSIDSDQLVNAIHDLSLEGASTRDIAKKLNISISEVVLAYSIIEKQSKNSELS